MLLLAEDAEEKLFSLEEETFHANEMSDMLLKLRKNPLNINTAGKDELLQLPWLSETDVKMILAARTKKQISSPHNLAEIGLDQITISDIKDYIIFAEKPRIKLKNQTRLEFNESKKDLPSSLKYYQRTSANYGRFLAGILTQKDEGERDPLDFYSYYLQFSNAGWLQNIVLGKYRLALGQGILFAPKLGLSKSAAATSVPVKRFGQIKPYTSSYEIWDLQGAGSEIRLGNFKLTPYFSVNYYSANLDSTKAITSFNESGLHLDESRKNNVQEILYGSAVQFEKATYEIGINYSHFTFDHDFADASSSRYEAANFFFIVNKTGFPIFGEAALIDGKWGSVSGIKFGESKFRQLLIARYYQKNLPTWHGNSFSAQSRFDNEVGLYYGITILPAVRNKINAYFDIWQFPYTRYFEKMPTVGSEQFLQWESHFSSQILRLTLQHKFKEKYISLSEAKIRDFKRTMIRLDWWQKLAEFTFKSRAEFVSEYLPEEKVHTSGFLFYEQLKLKLADLEVIAQINFYKSDTSPFKVKHYVYENNVDGIMQNRVVSGDGITSYLLVKYSFYRHFEIQFKLSDVWQESDKLRFYFQIINNW